MAAQILYFARVLLHLPFTARWVVLHENEVTVLLLSIIDAGLGRDSPLL